MIRPEIQLLYDDCELRMSFTDSLFLRYLPVREQNVWNDQQDEASVSKQDDHSKHE